MTFSHISLSSCRIFFYFYLNGQFLEIFIYRLREVYMFVLEQTGANGRVSAIAAEYEIRFRKILKYTLWTPNTLLCTNFFH